MDESRRIRRSTSARGYGWTHQLARKRLEPVVRAGRAVCTKCGGVIQPGEAWHLDHSDDRRAYAGAAHAYCNTTAPHRRASVNLDDYVDDPQRGIYWGPPGVNGAPPQRWSRPWTDWRDVPSMIQSP
jgi:hypothetical protein